ncbi:MAG TPA: DegT/DnrJ/EryC1/StrS family aminotransferase [Planctomycetota bacterium]|jgi:dTDP-4-amino-4,6-dideoxygalactose transaminase|nr:DegT/DnrJ/EryC1/StrS family aminotransferase [Planctomycetota bacterium]
MPVEHALKPIAPVDLAAERAEIGAAVEEAVLRVLRSGQFVLGPEVERFERAFAKLCGAEEGVGVSNGTDALIIALKAIGVKPGDHVVTSPFTFFASAGSIAWMGARPVLADVDPETAILDPVRAEAAVDAQTTCILPVHLYGQMADMKAFRAIADKKKLLMLEDAAQSHGAVRDGEACSALSDAAAFSFYPTKNLGAAGEGGMIVSRRNDVVQRARRLRDHGSPKKYEHAEIGTNTRLQGIQGAVLNAKLPRLAAWNERRREIARRYDAAFAGSKAVLPLRAAPGSVPVYHQYTVRIRGEVGRDAVLEALKAVGIGAAVHYATPVHFQVAARAWGYGPGDFPVAERLAKEVLCLPVHPFLSDADVDRVAEATRGAARG